MRFAVQTAPTQSQEMEQLIMDYFDTGFSVRQPMWHGQGTVLDEYPVDWADAREKAGLLWEPEARETYQRLTINSEDQQPTDIVAWNAGARKEILRPLPDHKLIVRNDTEHVLGVVGQGFELVDHGEMGEILEAVLGQENVKFETAGSVKDGALVWALAYLDEPYTVVGDNSATYPFIALLNAHDGTAACKLVNTQIRVVCFNTYRAAEMEGERHGRQYTFRHTAGIHDRIDDAKKALSGVRDDAKEWDKLAAELFGLPVSEAQFNHFLADFIPDPVFNAGDVVSERVKENHAKARQVFKHLYLDSVTSEAHRGTALGLVDASVEYLDHVRGFRNHDSYLGRTLLRPEPLKAKAVKLAREVARV